MKKIVAFFAASLMLFMNSSSVFAANTEQSISDLSIEITSPASIESKPVCEDNIEFTVTNNTDHAIDNIACYLMILDKGRGQTYPVDEFGQEAYQTREISSIGAGEQMSFTIPVKITYVGDFKFNISAIEYGSDQVYSSNTLAVHMIENSSMNKGVVMVVAGVVPIVMLGCIILFRRKKH